MEGAIAVRVRSLVACVSFIVTLSGVRFLLVWRKTYCTYRNSVTRKEIAEDKQEKARQVVAPVRVGILGKNIFPYMAEDTCES